MSSSHPREIFGELLAAAAASADHPVPGPHVGDDDELLERWSAGYLGPIQTRELTDHLAACPRCAMLVAHMVKSGVLVPPLVEDHSDNAVVAVDRPAGVRSDATASHPSERVHSSAGSRRPWIALASLSVAATLVAATLFFGGKGNSADRQLALARSEFARGGHLEALRRVEQLLNRDVAEPIRAEALKVAAEAAEKAAVERLEKGDFSRVREIAARVDSLGVSTDQLVNADLQARRGDSAIVSLTRSGMLLDYGYGLSGQALQKAFPTFDAAFEEQRRAWEKALSKHPESHLLRLNFGHFLLQGGAIKAAESQFTAVLDRQPDSVDARLGLGMAQYERQDYQGALDAFQTVLRERPQSMAAAINAALACESLERKDDAQRYWELALPLISDPALRAQIESHASGRSDSE